MKSYLAIFLVFLVTMQPCFGALSTGTIWEVHTGGSNTNGGCFDPTVGSPGTDFSLQDAAQFSYTDLVAGASNTLITSVARPFTSVDVGNCLNITAGTGWTTGRFEILSVALGIATVDRAIANAGTTGGVGTYGGALLTPAILNTVMTTNQSAWVKNDGTYSVAAKITYNFCSDAITTTSQIRGYTTVRGDGGHFILQASASLGDRIIDINCTLYIANLTVDCNMQTSTDGFMFLGQQRETAENVTAQNCTSASGFGPFTFFSKFNTGINIEAKASSTGILISEQGNRCLNCSSHDNTSTGFVIGVADGSVLDGWIAYKNTGATSDGVSTLGLAVSIINGVAQENGRDGIHFPNSGDTAILVRNNALISNVGYGINITSGVGLPALFNYNAYFGNGTAPRNNVAAGPNDVTLTGNPFTNPAGGDFSLNNTAGAGAALKGVGWPGALVYGGTGFMDIGALQAAGGASTVTVGYPVQ